MTDLSDLTNGQIVLDMRIIYFQYLLPIFTLYSSVFSVQKNEALKI